MDGLAVSGVGSWLMLAWVLVLGMVATLPLGAVFGAVFTSPRSLGLLMLPMMGLVAISGIFYPITEMAQWLQWLAQVFPIYWLGLGMRSAMMPDGAVALGLILAPIVLRRMARRESGSSVAERREKAMQRVG